MTTTRIVVVVGARPSWAALDLLGDVAPGAEAAVYVLGLRLTQGQRRIVDDALAMAADRRFVLTAELISPPSRLHERLEEGDIVRLATRPREAERWGIEAGEVSARPGR